MNDSIIKVEGLGKKYIISHEGARGSYTALRDVISNKAKSLIKGNGNNLPPKEEFWALKNISFDIKKGEAVGIIGRNGAGKSTLLKILSRITEPTAGRIEINGRVASLLEVGTGFHPELTGRENIFLNGAILGMRRAEIRKKFDEIVDFSGVEKFLDTPVKRYSSGMYVRLAFAVAAHLEPEILVIDEVLAVGDAEFQKKCLGKMESISRNEGRTVLFVSHNMDAIMNLCNKGILLADGTITQQGNILESVRQYQNSNEIARTNSWERNSDENIDKPFIKNANIIILGEQPNLTLRIDFQTLSKSFFKPAFVAFDIYNGLNIPIMQAIPEIIPFIQFDGTLNSYRSEIALTGLLPDRYTISIWIGPHNNETYDWQKNILSFEVTKSPTKGRTFPHDINHGYLVPISTIQLLKNE